MTKAKLEALLARVDEARELDANLLHEATEAIREVFPGVPAEATAPTEATEAVLHLVDRCLPGWTISLQGQATEPDGHWQCFLRESASRDDDAMIGSGRAPTVSLALLEAILKLASLKAR
ncbi:hypothetical protein [Roseitranquillus sediminis]|uniref:hypothetical protein n=1 Tax=Roseitranquillus sediminis TaxID=2809051 RepID=UPI001D0CC407|nr:hypothetical protein [Roseitranquillus sediminis]MBM9593104.1 hypothetical protein [Roseitranquillus sediminis]